MSRESRRRKELARQERRRGERERERELQHVATVTSQRPMPVAALQQAPTRRRRFGTWFREWRWTVLKTLPLGVVLPMSVFFGSVGPDDFSKNYAAWASKWGLTNWAEWLNQYATGPKVFWSVILFSIVYLMVAFVIPAIIRRALKCPQKR